MSDLSAQGAQASVAEEVTLTPADIPGAMLAEPLEKHPVVALRWWLLCRGVKASTAMRKKDLIKRYIIIA